MENAWSDTSKWCHWWSELTLVPKRFKFTLNFDLKSEDKEGQLDRFQRLQRYATVKNAQTNRAGPAPEAGAASGTEWSHFVTEMHVNASGRIEWNCHSNTYYAIMGANIQISP